MLRQAQRERVSLHSIETPEAHAVFPIPAKLYLALRETSIPLDGHEIQHVI
jgi:hypothetical protein